MRIRAPKFALLLAPSSTRAAVKLCLKVRTQGVERTRFETLVRNELARHPSH